MSQPMRWEPAGALEQRASHEDREEVAEVLRVAAGDGRLGLDELEERLEACFAARTYADLAPLVADLPGGPLPQPPAPPPAVKESMRIARAGGNVRHEGPWSVPKRLELDVRGGNVLLDFTRARLAGPVTEILVRLRGGNLRLIVPPGFAVDADEVSIRGGSVRRRDGGADTDDPPVRHRIVVTGEMAGGNLVVLPPKPPRRPGRLRRLFGRR